MGDSTRVLVVDDEPAIRDFLALGLKYEGFAVALAEDGPTALRQVREFHPDVVILDVMLPGADGWEVCRHLRANPELVVIFLTARDEASDRIKGLELGADDYVVKPFSFQELVLRLRLRLQRRKPGPAGSATRRIGDLELDAAARRVQKAGQPIALSPREYELLALLMAHPNQVLSKQQILDAVWGIDYFGDDNVVEVYIRYLREKLGDQAHLLIQTVRGAGYRLEG